MTIDPRFLIRTEGSVTGVKMSGISEVIYNECITHMCEFLYIYGVVVQAQACCTHIGLFYVYGVVYLLGCN